MDYFRKRGQSWTEKELSTRSGYLRSVVTTIWATVAIAALIMLPQFIPVSRAAELTGTICACVGIVVLALIQPLRYIKTLRKLILARDGEPDTEPPSEMLRRFILESEGRCDRNPTGRGTHATGS